MLQTSSRTFFSPVPSDLTNNILTGNQISYHPPQHTPTETHTNTGVKLMRTGTSPSQKILSALEKRLELPLVAVVLPMIDVINKAVVMAPSVLLNTGQNTWRVGLAESGRNSYRD